MKQNSEINTELESDYDAEGIFIDVCKAAVAIVLIGMVLYAAI
ncbi:hypothetical protein [Kangiella taiwanensis]|uniref:Uncharacterized protein n=1 Tax=Kangiella taiwanensis TaxID=1079179 RepID=A0ABP8HV57_9GAMM|nr:hypothetical protein [Kangiella taiwanensis]